MFWHLKRIQKTKRFFFRNKPNYATPPGVANAGGNKNAGGDDEE